MENQGIVCEEKEINAQWTKTTETPRTPGKGALYVKSWEVGLGQERPHIRKSSGGVMFRVAEEEGMLSMF